jgi:hypothetical protein
MSLLADYDQHPDLHPNPARTRTRAALAGKLFVVAAVTAPLFHFGVQWLDGTPPPLWLTAILIILEAYFVALVEIPGLKKQE